VMKRKLDQLGLGEGGGKRRGGNKTASKRDETKKEGSMNGDKSKKERAAG